MQSGPPPWGNPPPSWGPPPQQQLPHEQQAPHPQQPYGPQPYGPQPYGPPPYGPQPYGPPPYDPRGHGAAFQQGPPPWSPNAIAVICFCFTFLPAGIMHALNWERLGRPKAKLPWLIGTCMAFPLYMAAAILTPTDGPYQQMFMFANMGISALFWRGQQAAFDAHVARGGQRASVKLPVALSFVFAASLLAAGMGWAFVKVSADEARFEQGRAMLAAEDYAGAESRFLEHKREYPEETAAYHNLVLVYLSTSRIADARKELAALRKQDAKYAELASLEEKVDRREYEIAVEDVEAGRYPAAEGVLKRHKQKHPDEAAPRYQLSLLYVGSKRLPAAKAELEQLLDAHPDHDEARELLGQITEPPRSAPSGAAPRAPIPL